jgi:hypothetical protein
MARFLLVLQSTSSAPSQPADGTPHREPGDTEAMLQALEPVLRGLNAEVDHRTRAHMGALVKQGGENQRMQLFADVQSKPGGVRALELVLLSRESMGLRAPQTLAVFERLVALCQEHLQEMRLIFRSDRDGPLQDAHTGVTT